MIRFALALACCTHAAFAQSVINFQGVLVEDFVDPDTGEAVPITGARTIAVRLWNTAFSGASGEELLWARAYFVNFNADGYFSLLIGAPGVAEDDVLVTTGLTPVTSELPIALAQPAVFLGLTVIRDEIGELTGREEYYPRRQLLSAPFALYTDAANVVGSAPVEPETEPRFKFTSGRSASTQQTTIETPTVVVAEIRDFPVRAGALLHVTYQAPIEFFLDELFPLEDINTEFPAPRSRVTLDVRAHGASLGRVRTDQANTRPEFPLTIPEDAERVRPVFLNWVGLIPPPDPEQPEAETLVSVDVRLSMFDAFWPPIERFVNVTTTQFAPTVDQYSIELGMGRDDDNEAVFNPDLRVRHGDTITWGGTQNHEIVFLHDELGGALNFSLSAVNSFHSLVVPESIPIGVTLRYQCNIHPPIGNVGVPGRITIVNHLDSAAVTETQAQRLILREILPGQIHSGPGGGIPE